MSDENDKTNQGQGSNTGGAPSQTGPRAPLSLKPRAAGSVSTGTVKQSFSHGRSKTVVVETKRRVGASGPQRPQGFDVARPRNDQGQAPRPQAPRSSQPAGGALSPEEQEARRRAIALATQANAERERAAAAERAQREAEAREQAAATERAAQAARDEAAAAKAAAEAARAEAAKLAAAAPAPAAKPTPKPAAPAPSAPAAPAAQAPTP
ncbi:translation initiation factor IF-2 associated domain-containing protein, partial [uncultured Brevundimonas sp.]|uniref:translation initiation factor IF-2 associated domain-containing protein n=1 Tax=uncultured Brevundimonas sp. TaxID=213418 RepID=UPI00259934B9